MTTTTDATSAVPSAVDTQEGMRIGDTSEFTLLFDIKPGMADKLRESIATVRADPTQQEKFMSVGTVHDLRWVIFDNDTQLLFATNFDGEWDQYVVDFATIVPEGFDEILQWVEGYPGIKDPNITDYLHAHQVPAVSYFRAYPNATTREIQKALRVQTAFAQLLDEAST
jgi:hypothetical protein